MVIELYEHIRSLREDRDLSQKEIAAILGMSQTGYSKYETGENDIPTQILINFDKACRILQHNYRLSVGQNRRTVRQK